LIDLAFPRESWYVDAILLLLLAVRNNADRFIHNNLLYGGSGQDDRYRSGQIQERVRCSCRFPATMVDGQGVTNHHCLIGLLPRGATWPIVKAMACGLPHTSGGTHASFYRPPPSCRRCQVYTHTGTDRGRDFDGDKVAPDVCQYGVGASVLKVGPAPPARYQRMSLRYTTRSSAPPLAHYYYYN